MDGFLGKDVNNWIIETRSRAPEWFDFSENLNEFCESILFKLNPHQNDGLEIIGSILFKRILCSFQAIIILEERGMFTEALIQRRGMLEALFALFALWRNPILVADFVKNDIHRRKVLYRNIKELREKYQRAFSDWLPNEELEKEIIELTDSSQGIRYLSVKTLAIEAKLYDLYLTDYSLLSATAHHAGKDLERTIYIDGNREIHALIWGPEPNDPSDILYPSIHQLLMATEPIVNIFKLKMDDDIKKFNNEFIELSRSKKTIENYVAGTNQNE